MSNAETFQENPLTKAIQLFDKEKYSEAEPIFKKLLMDRPDDFMVNYFYGACRTENGHYSEQDLSYLLKASKEVNPLNIDYYFAVQYHAKDQWEKAMAYYKLYKTVSSANEQEKVGLALKMEQCANRINPFVLSEADKTKEETDVTGIIATGVTTSENADKAGGELLIAPALVSDSVNVKTEENIDLEDNEEGILLGEDETQDTLPADESDEMEDIETVKILPVEEQIIFNVNSEITYLTILNFRTVEGESYFKEGNQRQSELDKVLRDTEILREKYKNSRSRAEKDSIGQEILALEGQSYDLRSVVTQSFVQAKNAENGYWQNASLEEKENFIDELNALSLKMENSRSIDSEVILESPELILPPVLMDNQDIRTSSPKKKPSGIIYKIQLGAYSRGIPTTLKPVFSKISVLRKVENYTDENGVVVYTTGNLTNYEDAVEMQKQVKQEGIKDPKIAAYLNGKRITLEQAKELDKNR
ncbi:MAG TPA: hypothetical protein VLA03_08460 [Draconibacterium sp.]|nr:hypothetical protein [Draconibacterium sp.]